MTRLYIILPVHNRREVTAQFIDCLLAQTYPHYHLILVDDGSTDGTAEMAQAKLSNLTVLRGTGRWWWAGALQQGIEWLKQQPLGPDDVVLLINNDVTFDSAFLDRGVAAVRNNPRTLALAHCYNNRTGDLIDAGLEADLAKLDFKTASSPERVNCCSTRGLFVQWQDVLDIGDFHPRFLPHYLSDYEWTVRAHKMGYRLRPTPDLKLWLDETTTGFRTFDDLGFWTFARGYFSYRSVSNPWHWSAFAILTSPPLRVPVHLLRIWIGAAGALLSRALARRRR